MKNSHEKLHAGHIFCIIGKSSSGKDTIYARLLSDPGLSLGRIVTYTTRPMRDGETDGKEYHFVSGSDFSRMLDEGNVIESRTYHTVNGDWTYFTASDSITDTGCPDNAVIATPDSFLAMKEHLGTDMCIPIYIEVDDGVRLERAILRERQQASPDYREVCRRFLADADDFSEERLFRLGITNRFYNRPADDTAAAVASFIKTFS